MTPAALRAVRRRLGLTQQQLAERLGYSKRSIERMEAGEQPIREIVELAVDGMRIRLWFAELYIKRGLKAPDVP